MVCKSKVDEHVAINHDWLGLFGLLLGVRRNSLSSIRLRIRKERRAIVLNCCITEKPNSRVIHNRFASNHFPKGTQCACKAIEDNRFTLVQEI